jgi:hypothetical protein
MRSKLLVAHEKLGQFPLLAAYVVAVLGEKYILYQLLKPHHSFCIALMLTVV